MSSIRSIREEQSEARTGGLLGFLARQFAKLLPKKKAKRPGVLSEVRSFQAPKPETWKWRDMPAGARRVPPPRRNP